MKILWKSKGGNGFLCPTEFEEASKCGGTSVLALKNEGESSRPTREMRQAGKENPSVQAHGDAAYMGTHPCWVRGSSLKAEPGKGQGVKGLRRYAKKPRLFALKAFSIRSLQKANDLSRQVLYHNEDSRRASHFFGKTFLIMENAISSCKVVRMENAISSCKVVRMENALSSRKVVRMENAIADFGK